LSSFPSESGRIFDEILQIFMKPIAEGSMGEKKNARKNQHTRTTEQLVTTESYHFRENKAVKHP